MFISEQEFIFIEASEPFVKKYDNGNERTFRFLKVANPLTFENHTLSYSTSCPVYGFSRGEKVLLKLSMMEVFNRTTFEVIDIVNVANKNNVSK